MLAETALQTVENFINRDGFISSVKNGGLEWASVQNGEKIILISTRGFWRVDIELYKEEQGNPDSAALMIDILPVKGRENRKWAKELIKRIAAIAKKQKQDEVEQFLRDF